MIDPKVVMDTLAARDKEIAALRGENNQLRDRLKECAAFLNEWKGEAATMEETLLRKV